MARGTRDMNALCIVCSKPVPRPDRRTCGGACLRKLRASLAINLNSLQRAEAIAAYDRPVCMNPACGAPIVIRNDESPLHWSRRKTCSKPCLNALRAKSNAERPRRKAAHKPTKRAVAAKEAAERYGSDPSGHKPRRLSRPPRHDSTFETVAEARARGVEIKKLPPAFAAPSSAAIK